jgi:carbonic anhydrase/acetyltransferase-like protein (isoleucine patch superfamily)
VIRTCPLTGAVPQIDDSAYVDVSAQVIGKVRIGARSSLWLNVVVRGDVHAIDIGEESNVQDLSCLHVLKDRFSLTLGKRVSIGHSVTLHGCVLGDNVLVGMGAVILDGAEIGAGSLVAAGALVTPGTKVPPGSLVIGAPARVARPLNEAEREMVARTWENYVGYSRRYIESFGRGF